MRERDDKNWLKSITVKKVNDQTQIDTLALDAGWSDKDEGKLGYWG